MLLKVTQIFVSSALYIVPIWSWALAKYLLFPSAFPILLYSIFISLFLVWSLTFKGKGKVYDGFKEKHINCKRQSFYLIR